jgi:tRNA(fMet)-specific endonuclease VapC
MSTTLKYMLDTDTCSYLILGKENVTKRALQNLGSWCISAIVYQELFAGLLLIKGKKRESAFAAFLQAVQVIDFDKQDALTAADFKASLAKVGKTISTTDVQIAAQAANAGLTLVTNNIKHFGRIEGVSIENWAV